MESCEAIGALSALAHEHRLTAFRLLIEAGPSGLPAGEIAARMGVPPSTLSHHLGLLERARLLHSWRRERRIFYAVRMDGVRSLIAFLVEDCCEGRPELCGYGKQATCGGDAEEGQVALPEPVPTTNH